MKGMWVLVPALLPVVSVGQCSAQSSARPSQAQVEKQVRQASTEFLTSIARRDAELYDKRVADDAIFLDFGPGATSKFKTFSFATPADYKIVEFRVNNTQVKIEGQTAVVASRTWLRYSYKGKAGKRLTNFLNVFANRGEGWKLIVGKIDHP